jgi:hypothetical protein
MMKKPGQVRIVLLSAAALVAAPGAVEPARLAERLSAGDRSCQAYATVR